MYHPFKSDPKESRFVSSDYILGDIRILKADRRRCIICKHPTGDCVGEHQPEPAPEDNVVIIEDLTREFRMSLTQTRPIKIAVKGQVMSRQNADKLGAKY